jgi:hypothetical protein
MVEVLVNCQACRNPDARPVKIFDYKRLNCEKPWNKPPLCEECEKKLRKNRATFLSRKLSSWMRGNGWELGHSSYKRINANDWTFEN